VNVGPAQLPMGELRAIATDLGATSVSTYVASGNLLAVIKGNPDAFDRALEKALEERYGWFRDVLSRTPQELAQALAAHPFDVLEPKYSYVSFMPAAPSAAAVEAARGVPTGDDCWQVIGRDLHVRYADGAGRPQLKDQVLLKHLGQVATARNLNTVRKLIELCG
jgi:uncharacterized protein (DUF1697 family)